MTDVPRFELTPEELAEIAELEREDDERRSAERTAAKRQHLEALRLQKRLAQNHGTPGIDFAILESVVGNVAIRRPTDLEMDAERGTERGDLERYMLELALAPPPDELRAMFAEHAGLVVDLSEVLKVLQTAQRAEEAKK